MDPAVMPDLRPNAVRLQLDALAYNLGNFMRTLAMPKTAVPWSLTSLREKLIRIGREARPPRPIHHVSNGRGGAVATNVADIGFERLLRATSAVDHCASRSKERSWPRTRRDTGECGLKWCQKLRV
jgi:hypothetical protein